MAACYEDIDKRLWGAVRPTLGIVTPNVHHAKLLVRSYCISNVAYLLVDHESAFAVGEEHYSPPSFTTAFYNDHTASHITPRVRLGRNI